MRVQIWAILLAGALVASAMGRVGTPVLAATPTLSPTPTAEPLTRAQPPSGAPGTVFTITAVGFKAAERIETWANTPSGAQRDVPTYVFADRRGVARWQWASPSTAEGGTWRLVGRGKDSRIEQVIPLQILGPAATPTPNPNAATGTVSPAAGPPRTTFTFTADGYRANELVGFWATNPDGDVVPNKVIARADENGRAIWSWQTPAGALPGAWVMTGRGEESRLFRFIGFTVTPPSPAPPLPADGVEPPVGPPGTTFRFGASGFEREAKLTYWPIAPDGTTTREAPRIRADRNGHIEFTWQAPDTAPGGSWKMAIYGLDSGILKEIPFRIDRDAPPPAPQQSVSPSSGTYGDTLTFYFDGLPKGMLFGFWATDPVGAVVAGGKEVRAFDGHVRFGWQIPQTVRKGTWTLTLQTSLGDRSHKPFTQRIISFEVR